MTDIKWTPITFEDFPEWTFTFGWSSEIDIIDGLLIDRAMTTIKAQKGGRRLFATGADPMEAWKKLLEVLR